MPQAKAPEEVQSAVGILTRMEDEPSFSLGSEFRRLVETWRQETLFTSSIQQMAMHPAYQRIIGMGAPAIPLILRELQQNPAHWFWALTAITGKNPAEHAAAFEEAAEAWLSWGREQGYLLLLASSSADGGYSRQLRRSLPFTRL